MHTVWDVLPAYTKMNTHYTQTLQNNGIQKGKGNSTKRIVRIGNSEQ